jgi:hypothetical protein
VARKEHKKLQYLATLVTGRASAAAVAVSTALSVGQVAAPANLGLGFGDTWLHAGLYYSCLALGCYTAVPALKNRWYSDSGLR